MPPDPSFCFSAARHLPSEPPAGFQRPSMTCARKQSNRRAAEKQKEEVRFAFYYKQATPLGFLLQANSRKDYVSSSKMWVMTSMEKVFEVFEASGLESRL